MPAGAEPLDDRRQLAARFYGNVGVRPDHPGSSSFGEHFDRLWRAKGRKPENDRPEERLGYADARGKYVRACERLRANPEVALQAERMTKRMIRRTTNIRSKRHRPRPRGAGRPAARRRTAPRRDGDSGDSSDSDSEGDSEPPGVGRALSRARGPPLRRACLDCEATASAAHVPPPECA
jgi:hypothetical protein